MREGKRRKYACKHKWRNARCKSYNKISNRQCTPSTFRVWISRLPGAHYTLHTIHFILSQRCCDNEARWNQAQQFAVSLHSHKLCIPFRLLKLRGFEIHIPDFSCSLSALTLIHCTVIMIWFQVLCAVWLRSWSVLGCFSLSTSRFMVYLFTSVVLFGKCSAISRARVI